jgi:hypothetical protein
MDSPVLRSPYKKGDSSFRRAIEGKSFERRFVKIQFRQTFLFQKKKDEYKIEHDEKGSLIRECKKLSTLRKFLYAVGGM